MKKTETHANFASSRQIFDFNLLSLILECYLSAFYAAFQMILKVGERVIWEIHFRNTDVFSLEKMLLVGVDDGKCGGKEKDKAIDRPLTIVGILHRTQQNVITMMDLS